MKKKPQRSNQSNPVFITHSFMVQSLNIFFSVIFVIILSRCLSPCVQISVTSFFLGSILSPFHSSLYKDDGLIFCHWLLISYSVEFSLPYLVLNAISHLKSLLVPLLLINLPPGPKTSYTHHHITRNASKICVAIKLNRNSFTC